MSTFDDRNTLEDILGSIAFTQGYPDYWSEDEINRYPRLTGAFLEIHERISDKISRTRNRIRASWFAIARDQVNEAERLYLAGKIDEGKDLLFRASDQLQQGNKAHRRRTTFVIGEGGLDVQRAKDTKAERDW